MLDSILVALDMFLIISLYLQTKELKKANEIYKNKNDFLRQQNMLLFEQNKLLKKNGGKQNGNKIN